jgi:putative hydrolase of the HAD superfamily
LTIAAVVFDVDGVLVRSGEFGKILVDRYGISREQQSTFFRERFRDCVMGRADVATAIEPFLEEWSWTGSVEECLALWFEADSALNDDVLAVVPKIRERGRRCYVASVQEARRASYLTDRLGFGRLFDALFFSCHVGRAKDDTLFYDHISREIATAGDAILFLDDVQANVETAREAGWNAEVYTFGDDIEAILRRYGVVVS